MQNYIVAYLIPPKFGDKIRSVYENIFKKALPIENLHLTLIPPFSVENKKDLDSVKKYLDKFKNKVITLKAGEANLFVSPGESILYLPLEPKGEITKIYNNLNSFSKNLIKIETSLYHSDEVPPFLPHISLDYNFKYNSQTLLSLTSNIAGEEIRLKKLTMMSKTPSGNWKIIY
jgi:2'-5' RNA ligase